MVEQKARRAWYLLRLLGREMNVFPVEIIVILSFLVIWSQTQASWIYLLCGENCRHHGWYRMNLSWEVCAPKALSSRMDEIRTRGMTIPNRSGWVLRAADSCEHPEWWTALRMQWCGKFSRDGGAGLNKKGGRKHPGRRNNLAEWV